MRLWERYAAAIFDLDGTLADSMSVWDRVGRQWMENRGLVPPDDLEQTLYAMTLDQSAAFMRRRYLPQVSQAQILEEWNDLVVDRYGLVAIKPGAAELLRLLNHKRMPLALATSSFPQACRQFLHRHRLSELFSAVVYTDESGRDKSCPDIFLLCAQRLGVDPERCVVFEDLPEALEGVRAAGMEMVAVYDASCGDWGALRKRAHWAVRSLEELADGELPAAEPTA